MKEADEKALLEQLKQVGDDHPRTAYGFRLGFQAALVHRDRQAEALQTAVETEHVDTWCRYIAGMILCGADVFKGGLSEDAIAGIIKRRLCFLPHPPSPSVRLHLVKPAYSDGLHIKQWDNLGQLGEGVHELYVRGGQS